MKSKIVKQRNIPTYPVIYKSIKVKPLSFLVGLMIVGIFILFRYKDFSLLGVLFIAISTFCLIALPDAKIIEYTEEYAIIYNCKEKDECKIIYWDEILSWKYVWHTNKDEVIIKLIDNSTEVVETYKKSTIIPYFRLYAGGKEKVNKKK